MQSRSNHEAREFVAVVPLVRVCSGVLILPGAYQVLYLPKKYDFNY